MRLESNGKLYVRSLVLSILLAAGSMLTSCRDWNEKGELATAAMEGDLSRVKELFLVVGTFDFYGAEYPPPITIAAIANNYEVVSFIIESGGSVNVVDGGGFSTLGTLLIYKNKEMVEFMMSHGAGLNDRDIESLSRTSGPNRGEIAGICSELGLICFR